MTASKKNELSQSDLQDFYKQMLLIRRFEEKAGQLYGMGLIGGFCHLYIGQEAVIVGMASCLNKQDTIITSYRDHGHMLACGMDANGVMAELTGREGGYSKGKGGSMHMFSVEKGFFGGHGIVAAQIPLGTGIAFSHKYKNDGGVCLAFMGDGAVNQGQVYESFNIAALWNLPVIFVVENNQYGMGTSTKRASANTQFYKRGEAYGIKGIAVDGMDVLKVKEETQKALDYVRAGKGPFLLEMQTYRYRGHSMSDPAKYRNKEEVDKYKDEKDPIDLIIKHLKENNLFNEDEIKKIDKEVKEIVNESAQFAKDSPEPDASELFTDIII